MPPDLVQRALTAFGARLTNGFAPTEARSGAGVHRVLTAAGEPAYLKITPADLDSDTIAAAERELRFYRHLALTVPVRTPSLLNALHTDHGVALLLSDAGAQCDPGNWGARHWRALGHDLARLHTMPLPAGDWDRPDSLLAALSQPDLDQIRAFWSNQLPQLGTLLAHRDVIHDRLRSLPPVLVHGDCHTANIVHNDNELVFCDWQSTGVGRATSDLAFLSVRTTPSGTRIPAVVVDEYLRQRARTDTGLTPSELKQAIATEELAIFVFQWPPFVAYNSPTGIARVHHRARHLAALIDSLR